MVYIYLYCNILERFHPLYNNERLLVCENINNNNTTIIMIFRFRKTFPAPSFRVPPFRPCPASLRPCGIVLKAWKSRNSINLNWAGERPKVWLRTEFRLPSFLVDRFRAGSNTQAESINHKQILLKIIKLP